MNEHPHQLVKRFVAPTMSKALELVQQELGPEAVILSSKRVAKGVEIVTSLEPDLPTRGIDVRREFGRNFDAEQDRAMSSDSAWRSQAGVEKAAASYGGRVEKNGIGGTQRKSGEQLAHEIELARERMFAAKRFAKAQSEGEEPQYSNEARNNEHARGNKGYAEAGYQNKERSDSVNRPIESQFSQDLASAYVPPSDRGNDNARLNDLQGELADMRMLLEQQLWHMTEKSHQFGANSTPHQINMQVQPSVVNEHLKRLGLSDTLVQELAANIGPQARASVAWRDCMAQLAHRIPVSRESILDGPGVYAFVGQTGVGKTTTIAKLAAQYVLKHGSGQVALVTTDTYRVGAYDQLRSMGKILNVPVKVVDGDNSLLTVLSSLRQFPLILIDTAGFRHGDPLLKAQLAQLDASPMIKRVLVLSCNSQLPTMKASIHAHSGTKDLHSCVLTKLDESATLGEALSVIVQQQLPVAYISEGQEIPKDIARASGHGLVAKAVAAIKSQTNAYDHANAF